MAMQLSEEEWKQKLTPEQYRILREKGTEAPFTGPPLADEKDGMYTCVACGAALFSKEHKYESDMPGLAGWPSFSDIAKSEAVNLVDDDSLGMHRIEVQCANCGGHLGHVFDGDGASSTGKHYCINATCLAFQPQENKDETV